MKDKNKTTLLINVQSAVEDDEELERISRNLIDDLNEIDAVEKIDLVRKEGDKKEAPKGSKSGSEIVTLGSMLVTLCASAGSAIIPNLTNVLQSWLRRNEGHKISLEVGGDKLEVTGISDKEQQRLIDSWIAIHIGKK